MRDLEIHREVLIEAPLEVVWRTITDPEEITAWFAEDVELDSRPGGRGTLTFQDDQGTAVHVAPLVVETVEAPTRFSFRWCHPDGEEPGPDNSMLVEFTLTAQGEGRTRLEVTERGLEGLAWAEDDKARYQKEHAGGWATYLGRLKSLLGGREGG